MTRYSTPLIALVTFLISANAFSIITDVRKGKTFTSVPADAARIEPASPTTPPQFNLNGHVMFIREAVLREGAILRSTANLAALITMSFIFYLTQKKTKNTLESEQKESS